MHFCGVLNWNSIRRTSPYIYLLTNLLVFFILPRGISAQQLVVNEVHLDSSFRSGWVELRNPTSFQLRYRSLGMKVNGWLSEVMDVSVDPSGYYVIPFDIPDDPTIVYDAAGLEIVHFEDNIIRERLSFPLLDSGYGFARYPEESDIFIFVKTHKLTPGTRNDYSPSNWQKMVQPTPFGPRDSSPDASLLYNGKFWIFAGYQYRNGEWASSSEVWTSENGSEWVLLSEAPPYSPYSSFVNFQGYMWAIENYAYRSKDGINWENMGQLPLEDGGRLCQFRGKLLWLKNDQIFSSSDGFNWSKIAEGLPFGGRSWPGFISFQDRLWVIGGGIGYGTDSPEFPNDVWVSSDATKWEKVVDNAEWPGRYWFNCVVFDDQIWILGGWNYYDSENQWAGNRNDVWYSPDGIKWNEQENIDVWQKRHASFVWSTNEYLFFSSGYGGRGLPTMYGDFWRMPSRKIRTEIASRPPVQKRITIFPNPSTGEFSIIRTRDFERPQDIYLAITSSSGQIIKQSVIPSHSARLLEQSFQLPPGIYFIKLCEDQQCNSERLVIY